MKKVNECIDCGYEIWRGSKRCRKCYTIVMTERQKGEGNSCWRGGIAWTACKDCGKRIRMPYVRCRKCYYKNLDSKNNANWRGGKSFEPYPPTFNQQLKDRIRVRDNFICQLCGVPEIECNQKLDVHHIDYDKNNCEESNLVSLCDECNGRVNANREYWENYFREKTECSKNC